MCKRCPLLLCSRLLAGKRCEHRAGVRVGAGRGILHGWDSAEYFGFFLNSCHSPNQVWLYYFTSILPLAEPRYLKPSGEYCAVPAGSASGWQGTQSCGIFSTKAVPPLAFPCLTRWREAGQVQSRCLEQVSEWFRRGTWQLCVSVLHLLKRRRRKR